MADPIEVRDNPKTAYEPSDWPIARIGWIFLGTFAFLVIAPLLLLWLYSNAVSDTNRRLTIAPPAPHLQMVPEEDLARFRAAEDRRLNTYYWIDRPNGVVHIPIAEAMKKVARDGIAGFPKAPQ